MTFFHVRFPAEFFLPYQVDDLGKFLLLQNYNIKINICKNHYARTKKSLYYRATERLMFTFSADSGRWNIFSIYLQETKFLSVRDKIVIVNLENNCMHINTTNCVVLLHGNHHKILIWDWVILLQHNLFLISDVYGAENMPKKSLLQDTWPQDVV